LGLSLTDGQGADSAVVTVGVATGDHVGQAFSAIRKGGTVVLTAAANIAADTLPVNLLELTMHQKRVQGALFGLCSPTRDVPKLLDLYRQGYLALDELVSRRYRLEEINQGYADLHAGTNLRGVVDFR
jgi:S-(hydroxymethyl)glutathione dehydrogenase/alcohol dehydrogenase